MGIEKLGTQPGEGHINENGKRVWDNPINAITMGGIAKAAGLDAGAISGTVVTNKVCDAVEEFYGNFVACLFPAALSAGRE